MGLTRLRAEQISDIDYKQAVRVATNVNIVLAGSAPALVDGVTLARGNRVLVTAQNSASQNGLYEVQTVGTGSSGTWIRSSDANATGEIEAGMIVMVTEGLEYADTQWKLITDDPIVVGFTDLIFVENYSTDALINGTSNVVVASSGKVTISSAGIANVITVTNTGVVIQGNISVTGNVYGNNVSINRGAASDNWDNLLNMGTYEVDRNSWSGTIGTPLDSTVFVGLLTVMTSGTTTTQVYYPGLVTAGDVKIQWNRTLYDAVWTSWYKIINDDQVVDAGEF
jgi:hypothetical protein